MHWLRGQDLNL